MTWGKMDDKFHRNRKVRDLRQRKGGREALGVWVFWWSWCLDDPDLSGLVPASELSSADERSAQMLVDVGLWEKEEAGYRFHDFHNYNPTREQVDAKREADRLRVASKRGATRANVARDTDATNPRVASPGRVPSRPDPTQGPPGVRAHEEQTPIQAELEQALAAAYRERGRQAQSASGTQMLEACTRVANAVRDGFFANTEVAAQALAHAAVDEALKPKGKLGFALQDVEFAAQRKPSGQVVRLPGFANADPEWLARNPSRHVDDQTDFK